MVSTELSDRVLVLRAQDGDSDAFGVLYSRYLSFVKGMVGRISKTSDVDDLAQDVFERAFTRLRQLENPVRFKTWIGTIALRMAQRYYLPRKVRVYYYGDPCFHEQMNLFSDAIRVFDRAEEVELALGRLGDRDREMLRARYWEGLLVREMAGVFSAPEGTIKRRLHDARKRLHTELAL